MIVPNATIDRITDYKPDEACSTRDLVEDLYESCKACRSLDQRVKTFSSYEGKNYGTGFFGMIANADENLGRLTARLGG